MPGERKTFKVGMKVAGDRRSMRYMDHVLSYHTLVSTRVFRYQLYLQNVRRPHLITLGICHHTRQPHARSYYVDNSYYSILI